MRLILAQGPLPFGVDGILIARVLYAASDATTMGARYGPGQERSRLCGLRPR
jgi:hypothetical protein